MLINVPDPGTAQINRYYTQEFFDEMKSALRDSGVVSLSVLPTTEYLGHEGRQVSSIIYATLASDFANVLVLPGMKNHFLASDGPLRGDVARMVDSLGLKTTYVNPFYVDDRSTRRGAGGSPRGWRGMLRSTVILLPRHTTDKCSTG